MQQLHHSRHLKIGWLASLIFFFCSAIAQDTTPAYTAELQHWNGLRVQYLKSEEGWLNLAGLLWLKAGANTLGSDSSQQLLLPAGKAPKKAGIIYWENNHITLQSLPGVDFRIADSLIQQAILYQPGMAVPPLVSIGSLRFSVIVRGEKIGLRVRDLKHDAISHFAGIETFAPDTNFRVMARLLPASPLQTIPITNVMGQTTQQASPGTLIFQLKGQSYTLQCLQEDDQLFILFGDDTNAESTYGAGRFLYAAFPNEKGNVLLDFNKAFNPPCAYTPFATCPLPPASNQLKLAITAGEKFSAH